MIAQVVRAWREGASLCLATAAVGLPITIVYNVLFQAGVELSIKASREPDWMAQTTSNSLFEGFRALCALLFVYAAFQLFKHPRKRSSWVPVLFLLPSLFLALAFWFLAARTGQVATAPAEQLFFTMAWSLLVQSFAGAVWIVGIVIAADASRRGVSVHEAWRAMVARTAGVVEVVGTKAQAVSIGLQLLVPGLYTAVIFAFAEFIAILDPSVERPLAQSRELTKVARHTLFRLVLSYFILMALGSLGVCMVLESGKVWMSSIFDPATPRVETRYAITLVNGLTQWWFVMANLALYRKRIAVIEASKG